MRQNSKEIRPLTGVRGVAALFVVSYHFFIFHPHSSVIDHNVLGRGYLSVDLFFILSGMVMAMTYASSIEKGPEGNQYLRFLKNRIARVYPLYLALLLYALFTETLHYLLGHGAFPADWSTKVIVANLLLVQNWGFSASVISPSWSLSTEVAAYALFPALFALSFRSSRVTPYVAAVGCVLLLGIASTGHHNLQADGWQGYLDVTTGTEIQPLFRCIAGFTFGLLGYRLATVPSVKTLLSSSTLFIGVLLGTVAALYFGLHDLIVYVGLFLLVLFCYGNSAASNAVFGNRITHFLGLISYSIYLVHERFMRFIPKIYDFSNVHFGALAYVVYHVVPFAAVIAVAYCLYLFIEVPGRRFAKTLLGLDPKKGAAIRV